MSSAVTVAAAAAAAAAVTIVNNSGSISTESTKQTRTGAGNLSSGC